MSDFEKDITNIWSTWSQCNAMYHRWAANQDINYYQLLVLYAIDQRDALTQREICELEGLQKQTVNSVIRQFKAEGYVTLEPGQKDKREKLVRFTQKGRTYAQEVLSPLFQIEKKVYSMMGQERVQQLYELSRLFNLLFEDAIKTAEKEQADKGVK
ncbi:MAG: MarR family winged helix-turn-helix transcriptional regulator [Eubacteriales bacterium]|jgi:DNA-binding MarR family transcriptional regulator